MIRTRQLATAWDHDGPADASTAQVGQRKTAVTPSGRARPAAVAAFVLRRHRTRGRGPGATSLGLPTSAWVSSGPREKHARLTVRYYGGWCDLG